MTKVITDNDLELTELDINDFPMLGCNSISI